jgi:WD40 repeat protein
VCYRLWQNLAPDQTTIAEEDLKKSGNVDESLAEYYGERLSFTVAQTGISERAIREWFDHHLITESGIRGQVMMGEEKSSDLDNRAIRLLEDAHLVRAEKRRGVTWFELAHDRLIKPVTQDNARWSQTHLSLLQRQATLWENQDHFDGLVLREGDLAEAENWAAQHPDELTGVDRAFLKRCQDIRAQEQEARAAAERQLKLEAAEKLAEAERKRAEEQTRHAAQLRRGAVFLVIALLLALVMAALAGNFWRSASGYAKTQETLAAENGRLASTSLANAGTAQAASTKAISESNLAATAKVDAENQKATAVAERARADAARQFAEAQRDETERLRKLGLSNSLALLSAEYLDRQADLALLLGIESYRWNKTSWQAIHAMLSGLGRNIGRKAERAGEIPRQPIWIYDVAFSPNGSLLAWSGAEGMVVLWDLEQAKPLKYWIIPSGQTVRAISFNPKGSLIAYGASGNIVRLRNTSSGRIEKDITTSFGSIHQLAFSPNNKYLAISGDSRRVDLWDLDKWTYLGSLAGPSGSGPCSLAWSPLGNYLASGCGDKTVRIWNPATRLEERALAGHEGRIWSMAWSPDGRLLASAGEDEIGARDKTLLIWDLNKRTFTALPGHQDQVLAIAFSPDGRLLGSASADRSLILWDTDDYLPIDKISDFGNWVTSLDFSAGGEPRLAVASFDQTIRLYKVLPRESLYQTLAFGKGLVKGLTFRSDTGITIAGGLVDGVVLLDTNLTGEDEILYSKVNGQDSSMALHLDGNQIALTGEGGLVQIRDKQTGELRKELRVPEGRALSLAFSPDGNTLAVALCKDIQQDVNLCTQNEIEIWSLEQDPQQMACFPTDHTDAILSLAYDPGGKILASGGKDRNIWLYSGFLSGCPAQVTKTLLATHTSGVSSLAFRRPDGDLLAAGGQDGKLGLWVTASRQTVGSALLGNGGGLLSLAFSPDGKSLVSGDVGGFVLVWDMDVSSWMKRACDLAGRNLTQAEWVEFISGEYRQTCEQWPVGQ